jgi:hypothetical protein
MSKCLCGCKRELTGRQRMFASDACRQKYDYHKTANHRDLTAFDRESPGNDRELTAFDRKLTANHREFTNRREFTVTFSVVFVSGRNPGEWDMGLLDVSTKAEIERIIKSYLEYEHQGWQVTVKLTSNPQFRPFE